jgi:hypothetical protein
MRVYTEKERTLLTVTVYTQHIFGVTPSRVHVAPPLQVISIAANAGRRRTFFAPSRGVGARSYSSKVKTFRNSELV